MNDGSNTMPRLRIEVGRNYDRGEKEDQLLIKIAAKPGFGAFWNSLAPENLPGFGLIRNTPLEPFAKMANFWLLPVTAMLAPGGLRVDMQNDSPKKTAAKTAASRPDSKTSKGDLSVTDLDWQDI